MKKLVAIIFIFFLKNVNAQPKGEYCLTYDIWETYDSKTKTYQRPYDKKMEDCINYDTNIMTIKDNIGAYSNTFKILDYKEEGDKRTVYFTLDKGQNVKCTIIIYSIANEAFLDCLYDNKPTFRLRTPLKK